MGIGEGDEVRVTCRGKDCEAALHALVAALNFIMAVVVGQLVISLLIDYFGLLGLPKNMPSLQKLLGVSVVLAGFVIASRG